MVASMAASLVAHAQVVVPMVCVAPTVSAGQLHLELLRLVLALEVPPFLCSVAFLDHQPLKLELY